MDEDKFHIIVIIGLVLILVCCFMAGKTYSHLTTVATQQLQCAEVIDSIYEQCAEETGITISTDATWNGIQGRNVKLSYDHGVCVIK